MAQVWWTPVFGRMELRWGGYPIKSTSQDASIHVRMGGFEIILVQTGFMIHNK